MKKLLLLLLMLGTSFATLPAQDTIPAKTHHRILRSLIAPTLLIGASAFSIQYRYAIRDQRNKDLPEFHTTADNYLQFVPAVAVYGLDAAGISGKNDFANRTILLIKSELLMTIMVQSLKYATKEPRPDGSNAVSFPSGHTAQAFAAATFLHKEYGHLSVWYSIGGYAAASAVGTLRILNNKHWITDVLAGAGIGILSTNLAYLTHQYHWGKNRKKKGEVLLMPTYGTVPEIYFCYRFK